MVFGSAVRLPADLLDTSSPMSSPPPPDDFVATLRGVLRANAPMPFLYHGNTASRVPSTLSSCSHVFIRVDAVRRPLSSPYEGPYQVIKRDKKTFIVAKAGKDYTVSVDRLKPAFTSFAGAPDMSSSSLTAAVPAGQPVDPGPRPGPAAASSSGSDPQSAPSTRFSAVPDVAVAPAVPAAAPALDPDSWPLPTRYGRRPKPVSRFGVA